MWSDADRMWSDDVCADDVVVAAAVATGTVDAGAGGYGDQLQVAEGGMHEGPRASMHVVDDIVLGCVCVDALRAVASHPTASTSRPSESGTVKRLVSIDSLMVVGGD